MTLPAARKSPHKDESLSAEIIPMQGSSGLRHRPRAVESIAQPVAPADGVATTYSELVGLLAQYRRSSDISQLELDERAGFHYGYSGKLEIPHKADGRASMRYPHTFDTWLGALGLGLRIVPLKKVRKGWRRERIAG